MDEIARILYKHCDDHRFSITPVHANLKPPEGFKLPASYHIQAQTVTPHGKSEILRLLRENHDVVGHYYDERNCVLVATVEEKQ
ncbi:MAG: hypothetical protein QXR53_03540 [Candidatus Norongarragalinales archaeon]